MVTGETATGLSTINRLVLVEASNSNKTEERCFKRKITTQIQYLVVDDDAGVVLEVDELPVLAAEGFPLPDHYGRHHFLAQLRLALLDSSQNLVNTGWWSILFGTMLPPYHVPAAGGGQPVEPAPDPVHGDHVPARHTVQCNKLQYSTDCLQVLAAGVVGTVHDCAHRAGQRDPELRSCCSSTSCGK